MSASANLHLSGVIISIRHQLLDTCQLTIVTQQEHILPTSGFHRLIAHSFGYLKTKVQVCDVTISPVMSSNVHGVKRQLLDTDINYQMAVYFYSTNYWTDPKLCGTASYTMNRSNPLNIFAECT